MTALEIVQTEANRQTDPRYVTETVAGEIEVGTNISDAYENENMSEDILAELEKEGYHYEVTYLSASRIAFGKVN